MSAVLTCLPFLDVSSLNSAVPQGAAFFVPAREERGDLAKSMVRLTGSTRNPISALIGRKIQSYAEECWREFSACGGTGSARGRSGGPPRGKRPWDARYDGFVARLT